MSEEEPRTVDERARSARERRAADPEAAEPVEPVEPEPGRYRRGQEIARGGMGRVVEAEDALLGRTVALKETLELDDDARRRFEREVRITARLEHPSIVPVYDAGRSAGGLPFYVMRRLTGRPLDLVIREARTLDDRLTYVPNILAVLDAVGHAHRRGIVHRDLKPANVLLGELGETVVIDWGLAKVIGDAAIEVGGALPALGDASPDATIVGTVVGTPGFMPPEQAIGEEVDARSDVYALGATLYQLLAGRPPYAGTSASEILDRAVAEPPPPLPSLVPGVPPDLVTIVGKAMAPAAADRYDDAAAMGEDLRRFLTGRLVAAHHYSPRERLVRYVRQHRAILAVIGIAVIALALVGAFSLRRIIADRDRIATARAAAEARRADAEATARELRRLADGLIIDQARSYLAQDPTLAVAVLKQLPADSPQWPAARAVVAEARSRGIAFALRGHAGGVLALEIAPDRRHLLSNGRDGIVLIHDLETRTTHELEHAETALDRYGWAGGLIARIRENGDRPLDLIDPTSGRVDRRLGTGAITFSTSTDGTLVWLETSGSIHVLAPGGTPALVGSAPDATWVMISAAGGWIASLTEDDVLRLHHRVAGGWTPVAPPPAGGEITIDIAADDSRLAVVRLDAVTEWDLTTGVPRLADKIAIPGLSIAGYAGDQLFDARVESGTIAFYTHPRTDLAVRLLSVRKARFSAVIPRLNAGMVVLAGGADNARISLTTPSGPKYFHISDEIERVAARLGSPWLIGSGGNRLMVWDLRETTPAGLTAQITPQEVLLLGRHHVAFSDLVQTTVLDLRTGRAAPVDGLTGPRGYLTVADDELVIKLGDRRLQVLEVGTWTERAVEIDYRAVVSRGKDTLLVGDATGAIIEIALPTDTRKEVGRITAPIEPYALVNGDWVVMTGGAQIWRGNGTLASTVDAGAPVNSAGIDADGTVYAGVGNDVVRWAPGATATEVLLTPPVRLHGLVVVAPQRVIALADDDSMWVIDAATGVVGQVMPSVDTVPQLDLDGRCAIAMREGSAVIADLEDRTWWTLGSGGLFRAVLGPSCDQVFALDALHEIEIWDIGLTHDPAELVRWLADRTNAQASASHGVIEWLMPP